MKANTDQEKTERDPVPPKEKPGVYIKTFGCQMNEYDTEKMLHLLSDAYAPVDSLERAEVVILNTCSVREKAEHKMFSLLGELRERKESEPGLVVGVSGCVAQQEGMNIIRRNGAVDFVVGTHNLSLVPSLVEGAKAGRKKQVAVNFREEWEELPGEFDALPPTPEGEVDAIPISKGFVTSVRALVAIQRGCNKKCHFCVVPTTRGPEVSRDPDEILREIKMKVRLGAREVMLLGQTVNSYGKDLNPRHRFETLVQRVAEVEGLERIRFISPHPQDVRPDFIDLYRDLPQLMPQIHLPLQSGSDKVLEAMNRNYRRGRFMQIVDALRQVRPDIALSTDIIVGYPEESEEDFEQTLEVMREIQFDSAYYFKYSVRPNTIAESRYGEELPSEVLDTRFKRLDELQVGITVASNRKRIGTEYPVLVEGSSTGVSSDQGPVMLRGRIPHNTIVDFMGERSLVGKVINVRITDGGPQGLKGTVLAN